MVIAEGTPEQVADVEDPVTDQAGQFLQHVLDGRSTAFRR